MTVSLAAGAAVQLSGDQAYASPRAALSGADRQEMRALLDAHFEGVTPAQFERDLDEKDWVLRIRRQGRLVGFSTLQLYRSMASGAAVNVVYSGDTIVAPDAWGSPVLARGWIALVRALQAAGPAGPWYWLLLSSGFRTYRFLPVFWREYWPRHDAEMPPPVRDLLAVLARERFGDAFDAGSGVVRFAHPQRLRGALADVPDGRDADPHVHFFLTRNPRHGAGDELACLTALHDDNLTAAGRRMVAGRGQTLHLSWHGGGAAPGDDRAARAGGQPAALPTP